MNKGLILFGLGVLFSCGEQSEKENSSVGDDTIIAVNLTRQIKEVEDFPDDLKESIEKIDGVMIKHFIGGPCYQGKCFAKKMLHKFSNQRRRTQSRPNSCL